MQTRQAAIRMTFTRSRPPATGRSRAGVASIWGVIALLLATTLAAVVVRALLQSQRQFRHVAHATQIDQIHQAAVARQRLKLQATAEPANDTWVIPAEELGSQLPGEATFQWSPPSDTPRSVTITVKYPSTSPQAHRRQTRWTWDGKTLTPVATAPAATSTPPAT